MRKRDELSNDVKAVHKQLRNLITPCVSLKEATQLMKEHYSNTFALSKYAESMQELATQHWHSDSDCNSRIHWIKSHWRKFVSDRDCDRWLHRRKRKRIIPQIDKFSWENGKSEEPFRVLDVGSCYDPFSRDVKFCVEHRWDVTAIDVAPSPDAMTHVYKCDFVNVDIVETKVSVEADEKVIKAFQKCTFDVVIFSLYLEYLPIPSLRFQSCVKAYNLLKEHGLLFIVTPDSCHQTRNVAMIKSWTICLSQIGFERIYYQKLKHLHCMTFMKVCGSGSTSEQQASSAGESATKSLIISDMMFIPQDFGLNIDEKETATNNDVFVPSDNARLFDQLPGFM